jgi:tetratricopeptide (TPR) repeat protein
MAARRQSIFWIILLVGPCLVAGCTRNPEARKKKYADRASSYFQQGKYREAAIEYQNAIQIDPQFAEARYQLSQCFLKQGDWVRGYQELMRTIEIEPENRKAQLDLAGILLAAGKFPEAREHAKLVLQRDPQNAQAQIIVADADAGEGDLPKALGMSIGPLPI